MNTNNSRKFKVEREYYDDGDFLYPKKSFIINEGVTVLVGCNGSGKSTTLDVIKSGLKRTKTPCLKYDNLKAGGSRADLSNLGNLAFYLSASEGENIIHNFGNFIEDILYFIKEGKEKTKFNFFDNDDEEVTSKERWLLIDAVDSGLSIDYVLTLKGLFKEIKKHCDELGLTLYIVISANEFELACGEDCLIIHTLTHRKNSIKTYNAFKKIILDSAKYKEARLIKKSEYDKVHNQE